MAENLIAGSVVCKRRGGAPTWLITKSSGNGGWELPKEEVRRAESSVGSALRHLREKIGIAGQVLEEAGRISVSTAKNGEKRSNKVIFYLVDYITALPGGNDQEQKWLPYPRAKKGLDSARERKILESANKIFKEWKKQRSKS